MHILRHKRRGEVMPIHKVMSGNVKPSQTALMLVLCYKIVSNGEKKRMSKQNENKEKVRRTKESRNVHEDK